VNLTERIIKYLLFLTAISAVSGLVLITFFIFKEGLPFISRIGLRDFIASSHWSPAHKHFGIFPMIVGSLIVTVLAMVIGVPFGLACAIFLAEFCPRKVAFFIKPAVELLAGIPSVVYGFMGVLILVPLIRDHLGGPGMSVLACAIILGIMILPTQISISVDALLAVPRSYREASLAMGATVWQTTYRVVLKAARSGILAAVILAMGRAIGETMAVIMVAGNAPRVPGSILEPVRTLTTNIALEMGYAQGDHRLALFATGIVLFVIIMVLNSLTNVLVRRREGP